MLVFAGCAVITTLPPASPEDQTQIYSASYDAVWKATLNALMDLEYPIALAQKDGGLIRTDWIATNYYRIASIDSSMKVAGVPEVRFTVTILIDSLGAVSTKLKTYSQVKVRVVPHIEIRKTAKSSWFAVKSTGEIERAIFAKISKYLGG